MMCKSLLTVVDRSDHIQVPEHLSPVGSGEGISWIKVVASTNKVLEWMVFGCPLEKGNKKWQVSLKPPQYTGLSEQYTTSSCHGIFQEEKSPEWSLRH